MDRPARRGSRTGDVCARTENHSGQALFDALRPLVRLLAPLIREELSSDPREGWIDQATSPLGRRAHRELAKAGAFSAQKIGRRWLARTVDVDAYIRGHERGAPLEARPAVDVAPDHEDDDPAVRAALAEVGYELAPKPVRSRGGRR